MSLSFHKLRRTGPVVLGLAAAAVGARAQGSPSRWAVDPKASLAWWQISPNLNHLWATTCPGDPSWRPGEERSPGWHFDPNLKLPRTGYSNVDDTIHVPLFPRRHVTTFCVEAVRGEIVADSGHWAGAHGVIDVQSDALITGEAMRDNLMHQALETWQHPEIHFALDSLVNLTQSGDTVYGTAMGLLSIRGVPDTTVAAITMFPDAGGLRVLVKWRVSAAKLFDYIPKVHSFGLGLNAWIWHYFFMGADMVFHPDTATAKARPDSGAAK
ncbi:MAG TPA: YceI family protein [Gemmatimonadales bacterium]|nr:YceI family protein [Gemmatimonadales bacterium]